MSDQNPCLPEAVWSEILKFLPVKILGQCRCVSKSWCSLVASSSFVTAHLKNYTQNESNSLLLYRQLSKPPEKEEQYTLFFEKAEKNVNLVAQHKFICPFKAQKGYFRVVGCVNGLVCLSDDLFGYTYLIILWNPLIHKYIKLPMPRISYHVHGAYISILGFGYDAKKGDHKVVRLVYIRNKEGFDTTPPEVEVYSVGDGTWRSVCADTLADHCICDRRWSQCFLNGAIHWVAWKRDARNSVFDSNWLLLFDVEGEKFKRMKLPEGLVKACTLDLHVSEYGGRLLVLHSIQSGGIIKGVMARCDIWVKREYTVGSSWSRMISIELGASLGLGWVQCLRKNGELVAFTKEGELVSYDPNSKQIKGLDLCGCWLTWFTGAYAESLVLLDKGRGVQSYDDAGKCRKRFLYGFYRNGDHFLEEVEVDRSNERGQSTGDNIIYEPAKFLLLEQLMKFDGCRDPSKIMSLAVAYGF